MREYRGRSATREEVYAVLSTMEVGEEQKFRLSQRDDVRWSVYYWNRRREENFTTRTNPDNISVWRLR